MGYSIGVRARSAKLQETMLAFLAVHYRNWAQITGGYDPQAVTDPTDDADYDNGKNFVGFNYGCLSGYDRFWNTTTCRWIALKVGRRKRKFNKDVITPNELPEPTPFLTYDGYQHWPVIVCANPKRNLAKGQQWCSTDKYGFPNNPKLYEEYATTAAHEVLNPDNREEEAAAQKAWKAFMEEAAVKNWEELELAGKITRQQWIDESNVLMAKHFKPLMEEAFKLMRAELKRLDDLWEFG